MRLRIGSKQAASGDRGVRGTPERSGGLLSVMREETRCAMEWRMFRAYGGSLKSAGGDASTEEE